MKAKGIAAALCLSALWTPAAQQPYEEQTLAELKGSPEAEESRQDSHFSGTARLVGVTLVLIGIAGGLYIVLARLKSKRPLLRGSNIKVLETAYLSQKHSIALVRVRNRVILLGMGEDVQTLASFEKPEEVLAFGGDFERELKEAFEEGEESKAGRVSSPEPVGRLREAMGRWRKRLREGAPS